jgi:cleavage and polyadenylation specificity factor subunit 1
VQSLSGFNTAQCEDGFAFLDKDGSLGVCKLPSLTTFGHTGWPTRRVPLGEQVDALVHVKAKNLYVLGTTIKRPFKLPEDDYHHEWNKEELALKPLTDHGALKLYHPQEWFLIHTFPLETSEVVLTMKVLDLVVSEKTEERKPLVVVGTGTMRGEDLPTMGAIYVFDVVNVVPEPGRPETGFKLHLIHREQVKGAVTAVTEIGTQGFLFAAQGQKGMVRGLKEDNTLLPTAFVDMNNYVITAKNLKGTGFGLLADLVKGMSFFGYTASLPRSADRQR